jgi:hypothetical protein
VVAFVAVISLFALFVQWSTVVGGSAAHGRFLVGAMPIVDVGIVLGLRVVSLRRWPALSLAFAVAMLSFATLVPFSVILPAYRPPVASPDDVASVPEQRVQFGAQLTLVGSRISSSNVSPGAAPSLTLYWTTDRPSDLDLHYRVRVVARDGTTFFDKVMWPAGGGVPTYTWPPRVIYRDVVAIPVPTNVSAGLAHALLSVQPAKGDWPDAQDAREVEIDRLGIGNVPTITSLPRESTPMSARFGEWLDLVAVRVRPLRHGEPLSVALYWRAEASPPQDETVSVQLLNAAGNLVAQHDGEPANGGAPMTTWPADRIVEDSHQISLPGDLAPGDYRLSVVVYDRASLTRLLVTAGGTRDDRLGLGTVRIQ